MLAWGILTKNSSEEELFRAISEVIGGGRILSKEIRDVQCERLLHKEPTKADTFSKGLTYRGMEISILIKTGYTSSQIAKELFLSIKTIESHRREIVR